MPADARSTSRVCSIYAVRGVGRRSQLQNRLYMKTKGVKFCINYGCVRANPVNFLFGVSIVAGWTIWGGLSVSRAQRRDWQHPDARLPNGIAPNCQIFVAFCLIYRKTLSLEKVPNLCVGDCAYKRTDGVYVVPVGCLRDECSIICLVSCHRRGG